jgi:hypothetical protein
MSKILVKQRQLTPVAQHPLQCSTLICGLALNNKCVPVVAYERHILGWLLIVCHIDIT